MPFVNPVTCVEVGSGEPVTSTAACAIPPIKRVTVYLVNGLPPFTGAVQVTVAVVSPAVALTAVGAPGAVGPVGVTEFDGPEGGPVPTALVAVTVNV